MKSKKLLKPKRKFKAPDLPNNLEMPKNESPEKDNELGQSGSNPNDPGWYGRNKLLTQTLGLVNFSEYKGTANHLILQATTYDGTHLSKTGIEDYHVYNRFPGIMIHDFTPTFGSLNTSGNDAEEMARLIYANIRRVISGRRNYDATAVLQYILAVGSLQAAFGELHRVLAAVRNRNAVNRYFGERLVEALGYEYDDIVANYNMYAFAMNQVALTAETLALPEGIKLFDKWYRLNSSVFADTEDPRSGLYAFVANGFWVWRNLTQVSHINWEHIKQEVVSNHAPTLGSSVKSSTLTPGVDTDLAEFAPYGLVLELWPAYNTLAEDAFRGGRFENILNTLRRAAHEYIDNHDFNLIAADLRKAYGDSVVTVKQFVPDAKLNVTYDALMSASVKNLTYAPFFPIAALEFPAQAWEAKGHRNGLVYVVETDLSISYVLNNAVTKNSDGTLVYSSKLTSPQTSYVFSKWEKLTPEETMEMMQWQLRYRITAPDAGNVIIHRQQKPTISINPGQNIGLNIEAMGTEVITASRIYGIRDNLRGLGDESSEAAFTALSRSSTTYGQIYYYYGVSNYISLPRYFIPKADALANNLNNQRQLVKEYNSLVVSHDAMAFIAWARHWDCAPALYLIISGPVYNKKANDKLYHWSDVMSLNPWPHYAVLDANTIRRHHEVALASLIGVGTWGAGTINSEQTRPGQSLDQKGIQS